MRIPTNEADQFVFYEKIINQCFASRQQRMAAYARWRNYYLYGTDAGDTEQTYNKIYPHIDQILSFMYSNETTQFGVQIAPSDDLVQLQRVPIMNRAVNYDWHASNTDIVFSGALEWAHVYASTFLKLRWNNGHVQPFVVDPHDFGVEREDISMLERQQAFCQNYFTTRAQLESELKQINHPRINQLLTNLPNSDDISDRTGDFMQRVITSQQSPTSGGEAMTGSFNGAIDAVSQYRPTAPMEVVDMKELYVYDDSIEDYRIITLAGTGLVVFDRPLSRMFVDRAQPFIQVCPVPCHDYFFGRSEVERLIPLQKMRNERFNQVKKMMSRQAEPPITLSGFPGITDEIANQLNSPAGVVVTDQPGAKAELMSPQIPDDLFQDIIAIDQQFEEQTGVNNVMSGRGEAGVRSEAHAAQLANLGSSRTKKRALVVEDALEKIATLFLKMLQKFDAERKYVDEAGDPFTAGQFTEHFVVKVDAHSNSPLFTADQKQMAIQLFQLGAITKERLVELMGLPLEQLLVKDLKDKIEPADAAQAAAQQAALKAKGGGSVRSIK